MTHGIGGDHNINQPQRFEGVKSIFANLSAKLRAEAVIIAKVAIIIFKEIVGIETFKGLVANFPSEETKARQATKLHATKAEAKQPDRTEAKQPSKVEAEQPEFSVEWVGEDDYEDGDTTGLARNTAPQGEAKTELSKEQLARLDDLTRQRVENEVKQSRAEGKEFTYTEVVRLEYTIKNELKNEMLKESSGRLVADPYTDYSQMEIDKIMAQFKDVIR